MPLAVILDIAVSTHSRLKAAGAYVNTITKIAYMFQHTAA